jgi:polyisoprenoid-binding protein YceI
MAPKSRSYNPAVKFVRKLMTIGQKGRAIVLASLVAIAWGAAAAAKPYLLDNKHTEVLFTYRVGFVSQSAKFTSLGGVFDFDARTPGRSSMKAVVKTESLTSDQFEEKLKSSDFFDVAIYPEISFVSNSLRLSDPHQAELAGDLTMKGVTQPVIFQLVLEDAGTSSRAAAKAADSSDLRGFTAKTRIRRSAFNMTSLSFLIDDEIEIQISAVLLLAKKS